MNWLLGGKTAEIKRLLAQLLDPSRRDRAARDLLQMGAQAAPQLIEALQSRDPGLPPLIRQILIRMGPAATPALAQALSEAMPSLRLQVCEILAQSKDRAALPALIAALRGEYLAVRSGAATALGLLADPAAIHPLLSTLQDASPEVRAAAALALGSFPAQETVDALANLLFDDPEIEVRLAAIRALGKMKHPAALPYLMAALRDSYWWYERESTASDLLAAIQAFGSLAVEPLIEALNDRERTVRLFAAQLLGQIGDARAIEPLGMAIYDLHYAVGRAAAEALAHFGAAALGVLSEALKHPEAAIRMHAISALAKLGNAEVFPLLAEMLNDPDRNVQKEVIQALGKLGDRRARPVLEPIAENRLDREFSLLARTALQTLND